MTPCNICGREAEHAEWCGGLRRVMRERDRGGQPTEEWPGWLKPLQPTHGWNGAGECFAGHPLTPENIYVYPDGSRRRCKVCAAAWNRGDRRAKVGA